MKTLLDLLKGVCDEKIVRLTKEINTKNPMIDRIMNDDTVEGVLMTNREGVPILTNMNSISSIAGAEKLTQLGSFAVRSIAEVDPLDEILTLRLETKKDEILLSLNYDFNVIVFQHAKTTSKMNQIEQPKAAKT